MTPAKFDLHQGLHKGLRKRSAELLVAIGQADYADAEHRSRIVNDTNKLLRMLSRHDLHEEAFLHPILERLAPQVARLLDSEHGRHADLIDEVKRCIDALQHAPRRDVAASGRALYLTFARFVAADLRHMDYEEREAWARLEAGLSPSELHDANNNLLATMSHEELMETLQAVLPALNPTECALIVERIRIGLPRQVASGFVAFVVKPMLGQSQYARLLVALDDARGHTTLSPATFDVAVH